MKRILFALILVAMAGLAQAEPRAGSMGVGAILGDINGPTVKYFVDRNTAVDVGVGFDHDMEAYANVLFHGWNMFPKPQQGRFAGYLGGGFRYQELDHDDDKMGARLLGGMGYWMDPYPIEFFVELGPWFVFTPDTDTEMDFGIGARFYFGRL